MSEDTTTQDKHSLIDEIHEGMKAIEGFGEDMLRKIELFLGLKKDQVQDADAGLPVLTDKSIAQTVNTQTTADVPVADSAPAAAPAAASTTQTADSAVGTTAADPTQPAA